MASHILFLFFVFVPFCYCFLTDNTQSSHHDSTGDLLAILVEEKDLRHQLAEAVTQMKSEFDFFKSNFSSLQSENAVLKQTLNNNTDANTHVIQNLQQTLNSFQSENAALKNITDANKHDIQNLQQTLNDTQQPKQQVIFSTFSDSGTNKILANIGGGYQNGVFTCPVAGVYMFSITLGSRTMDNIGFIYLNDRVLTSILLV